MSSAARWGSIIVVVLSLLVIPPAIPTRAQQNNTPVFRSTSRLVQLNAVVLDQHGRPVIGLSPDDFQVFDNGRVQHIVHFTGIANGTPAVNTAAANLQINNREYPKSDSPPGMTVILVDELVLEDEALYTTNVTDFETAKQPIKSARLAVLKFLATLQPGEQVALYALRHEGVVVIHDFSDDSGSLVSAAKKLGTGLRNANLSSDDTGEVTAARDIRRWMTGPFHNRIANRHDLGTILDGHDPFLAIAQHLQGIPGRKNLVWISSTMPSLVTGLDVNTMAQERDTIIPNAWGPTEPRFASPQGWTSEVRGLARWVSSQNISLYPMDPNGLVTADISGNSSTPTGEFNPTGIGPGALLNPTFNSTGAPLPVTPTIGGFTGQWNAMDLMASETGGRAIYDANALDQHLREIVSESNEAYQIGYYPGDGAWDGKYHQIRLKVKREAVKVLCRQGYYAKDEPLLRNPEALLRTAARSPLDSAGIGLTLNVASNPLEWGLQQVVLKVDAKDLHFEERDGRWHANLDLAFASLSREGRILGGIKDHVELALYPDSYAETADRGWLYPKTLFVDSQAERLRVIVRDVATDAVGSVSVRVHSIQRR